MDKKMSAGEYYILAFDTTGSAMKAEACLKEHFTIAMMPVPREISHGCGLAVRFQDPEEEAIVDFLSTAQLNGTLYRMGTEKIEGKYPVEKIFERRL